jgi:hypothetical protein
MLAPVVPIPLRRRSDAADPLHDRGPVPSRSPSSTRRKDSAHPGFDIEEQAGPGEIFRGLALAVGLGSILWLLIASMLVVLL